MPAAQTPPPADATHDPWYEQQPRRALAIVAVLFLAVFTLRLLITGDVDSYSMLYVLPVALAAIAFGQRAGIAAAALAITLIEVSALLRDLTHDPGGWATRVVPIVLLGVLLGRATDRAREAEAGRRRLEVERRRLEAERRRLEVAALLHRQAIEINDSLIQRMTAAKWSLEAGRADAGLEALTAAVTEAQQMVSGLIRRADMGARAEYLPGTQSAPDPHPDGGR